MKLGILGIYQNYQGREGDEAMMRAELRIAELAEELGFDSYWPPEHHFTDYSACPDNLQLLSWLAGRTKRIRLGTGAVIVPWNDPLRVAEKITLLDHLSGGRAILGLGRGLSPTEYAHFQIDMAEAGRTAHYPPCSDAVCPETCGPRVRPEERAPNPPGPSKPARGGHGTHQARIPAAVLSDGSRVFSRVLARRPKNRWLRSRPTTGAVTRCDPSGASLV